MIKPYQKERIADFFRIEHQRLVSYVRRWIDDTAERDGEDIVQDVALNIFDRADLTIPIEYLSAYVYRAVRNRTIDFLRKRKRPVISLDRDNDENIEYSLSDLIFDRRYEAEKELEKKHLRARIYKAINSLSDQQKAIVIETEFEERTFRELAHEWNIPIGTLLARKSRALKKIRKILEKEDKGL
jgi:RNA polymerase sigma factor (sigma-70 family)